MNELIEAENTKIEDLIYKMRGKQVMLDSDLAKLYQVETKRINEAVKNNLQKFPERFSFRMTSDESQIFLVENFDQKIETRGGKYNMPYVFISPICYNAYPFMEIQKVLFKLLTMVINYDTIHIDWYSGNFRSPESFFLLKEVSYERI